MLIDSHCHLDFADYDSDRADMLARARDAGVGLMLSISTKIAAAEAIIALAESADDVLCTIGSHPHEAASEHACVDELTKLTEHPKVIGIGETGLDYYYANAPRTLQQDNFRAHIAAARTSGLPLIIHARDADDDIAAILEDEMTQGEFSGLIHCFTGGATLAAHALALGFYISVSGIVTFKNAVDLRDIIATVPLERLLLETDAPFLAPVPHRGKRNEPSFITHTASMLADIKGVSDEAIAAATTENFYRLFRKCAPRVPHRA